MTDTLIYNTRIRDPDHKTENGVDAVAVSEGRIVSFGASREMLREHRTAREVVDADGGVLMPAFTDSHTHFKRASMVLARYIDFAALEPSSIGDVLEHVKSKRYGLAAGDWIQGDSLNPLSLREKRFPTRYELDSVVSDTPVVVRTVGRHSVAANSLALERASISAKTDDPPGGRIERDGSGEPIGVLHEEAQLRLDANRSDSVIPKPTIDERVEALREGVELLNSLGIVAVHEIPREPDQLGDWLRLREEDEPRVRVRFYIRGLEAQTKLEYLLGLGLRGEFGDEWLRIGGIKISIDGSALNRNALMYEPYPGEPDNTGLQRVETSALNEAVRQAHDARLQVAIHAIGPRAVDLALTAYEGLQRPRDEMVARRHRIEHAYLPDDSGQLERMQRLGLVYSTQPSFIDASGDSWCEVFGEDAMDGAVPLAKALSIGLPTQINSDFPCSLLNPFVGIKAAATRRTRRGRVLDPRQAISVAEAIRMMTVAPAFTAFEETWRGRLLPGFAADLILTDRDPTEIEPDDLDAVQVLRTIVGGRTVFTR